MMSTFVLIYPLFFNGLQIIGKTLSIQLFHVFRYSIPEYAVLSAPVHPSTKLALMEVPDE